MRDHHETMRNAVSPSLLIAGLLLATLAVIALATVWAGGDMYTRGTFLAIVSIGAAIAVHIGVTE